MKLLKYVVCLPLLTVCVSVRAQKLQFNREIRPILSENCFACWQTTGWILKSRPVSHNTNWRLKCSPACRNLRICRKSQRALLICMESRLPEMAHSHPTACWRGVWQNEGSDSSSSIIAAGISTSTSRVTCAGSRCPFCLSKLSVKKHVQRTRICR